MTSCAWSFEEPRQVFYTSHAQENVDVGTTKSFLEAWKHKMVGCCIFCIPRESHFLLHEVSPDLRRIAGLVHRLDKLPDDILVTIPLILRGQLKYNHVLSFAIQERALHVHHHELVVTTSFGVQGILSRTETRRSCKIAQRFALHKPILEQPIDIGSSDLSCILVLVPVHLHLFEPRHLFLFRSDQLLFVQRFPTVFVKVVHVDLHPPQVWLFSRAHVRSQTLVPLHVLLHQFLHKRDVHLVVKLVYLCFSGFALQ